MVSEDFRFISELILEAEWLRFHVTDVQEIVERDEIPGDGGSRFWVVVLLGDGNFCAFFGKKNEVGEILEIMSTVSKDKKNIDEVRRLKMSK